MLRSRVRDHLKRLRQEGCRAAGYALSGDPPWPHICSKHIDGWRVLVAFPADNEVAVLKIERHDDSTDPYRNLAIDLGIAVSTAERTKPPCCDYDGSAPVDASILDSLGRALKAVVGQDASTGHR